MRRTLTPEARQGLLMAAVALTFFLFLWEVQLRNYLLFHSASELFSLAIAFGVFMFAWNTRKQAPDGYFLFIGFAFLGVGLLHALHLLSYKGMGVFPSQDVDTPTQLWVSARLTLAAAFFFAPWVRHQGPGVWTWAAALAVLVSVLSVGAIFIWDVFPPSYIEGSGLTPFKIWSEYLVMAVFAGAILVHWRHRKHFEPNVARLLLSALALSVVSEIAFSLYSDVYGRWNAIGHFLVIASFYLMYRATLVYGLTQPYDTLFRDLKRSERRFALFMAHLPAAVVIRSLRGDLLYANKIARRLAGDEAWKQLALSSPPVPLEVEEDQAAASHWIRVETLKDLQGKNRVLEMTGFSLTMEGEAATGLVAMDVTERLIMEERLRAVSARFRLALRNANIFMYRQDHQLKYTQVFNLPEGTREEELLGKTDRELYPSAMADRVMSLKHQVLADGRARRGEIRQESKGQVTYYELIVEPDLDATGEIRGVICITYDITLRKRAEDGLRHDNALLERLVEERTKNLVDVQVALERSRRLSDLGALAARVAHELRNPLSVMRIATFNLERKLSDPELTRHLASINKKITDSEHIINNMLTYTRIKMPQVQTVPLADLLAETLDAARERFDKKSVSWAGDWAGVKDLTCRIDPLQMREVLDNLLMNAWQAAPEEGGHITLEARPGETGVVIRIHDNGAGIAEEDLRRVFEPFFTRKAAGTGLGLPICQELVGLNGGAITIDSRVGEGTTVTVTLPSVCQIPEGEPISSGASR